LVSAAERRGRGGVAVVPDMPLLFEATHDTGRQPFVGWQFGLGEVDRFPSLSLRTRPFYASDQAEKESKRR
jgi:hypothetical protein